MHKLGVKTRKTDSQGQGVSGMAGKPGRSLRVPKRDVEWPGGQELALEAEHVGLNSQSATSGVMSGQVLQSHVSDSMPLPCAFAEAETYTEGPCYISNP